MCDKAITGAVEEVEKDENQYNFHHISRDQCPSELALLCEVCRYVTGCLNSRCTGKTGVFVGGVRPESDEKPFVVEGLPFLNSSAIECNVRSSLSRCLFSTSGGMKLKVTNEELQMVKVSSCETQLPANSANSAYTSTVKTHMLVITVHPLWSSCKDRLYCCSFPDKNGVQGKEEVYVFKDRSLIEERVPTHVKDLERLLKDKYYEFRTDKHATNDS